MIDIQQYAYEIHRPAKKKFHRREVFATRNNDIWSVDLLDVSNVKSSNDNTTFLLIIVDVYSRYAFAMPLKSKKPKSVVSAFEKLKTYPINIWTDEGGEFYNKEFQKFCKQHNINHYHTYSGIKSAFAERFNRTLREMMYRYFTEHQTQKYNLNDLISAYNNKIHSTIKQKPIDVYLHGKEPYKQLRFINAEPLYKVGMNVRISKVKKTFEKGYTARWSKEVFTISNVDTSQYPTMYDLVDLQGEEITGKFYEDELQPTNLKDYKIIEKIVETKTKNRVKWYLVKYLGYGEKFNEWITARQYNEIQKSIT